MIIKTFLHQKAISLHREKSELLKCRVQKKESKLVFWYGAQDSIHYPREAGSLHTFCFDNKLLLPSSDDSFSLRGTDPMGT